MLAYTAIYDLKNPAQQGLGGTIAVTDLQKKCIVAVAIGAQAVLTEAQTTPNHNARMRWATNALMNAETVAQQMMWAVLSNGTVQAAGNASSDNDVQYVVNVSIDLFAQ
jgi:hypothetical protein